MLFSAFYVDDWEMRKYTNSQASSTRIQTFKKNLKIFHPWLYVDGALDHSWDRFQKDAVSVSEFTALVKVWCAWTDKASVKFIMCAVTPTVMLGILINETLTAKYYAVVLNELKILWTKIVF